MQIDAPTCPEVGSVRILYSPDLELSLDAALELVSMIEHHSGIRGLTVTWQADHASPPVLVRGSPRHLRRAIRNIFRRG